MRIFASWSGERSRRAAEGLRSLLEIIFEERVQVFFSNDIAPGEAWAQRLGAELEQSDFGILCLTRENFQSPWLLFEAGAIAKKFGTSRVVPYLIDELPQEFEKSPLGQFQHVSADVEGTTKLVGTINKNSENPQPNERLQKKFNAFWRDLDQTIIGLRAGNPTKSVIRTDRELLETILRRVEELGRARGFAGELSGQELAHLRTLRDQPTTNYSRTPDLQKELRKLRDSGYITNRKPIADLPATFRLDQYFDLTDKGKEYLQDAV